MQQEQIDHVLQQANAAFLTYKNIPAAQRASFLEAIAAGLDAAKPALVPVAMEESHLPEARLNGEVGRTSGQLRLFAALIREGSWVEAAIDTALPDRVPARPDIRKLLIPMGPVVVFGASNFPFAFSTAGGDTASALAVGCPVVVKGHPAHPQTSRRVFAIMEHAAVATGMPAHVVQHVEGGNAEGEALVKHPLTAAVGFTGSLQGGKALLQYASERKRNIPVFAEMSSVNPVVLLPDALEENAAQLGQTYAGSITLGMGQFCTNPGILLGIESEGLQRFSRALGEAIAQVAPQPMLHAGICAAYAKGLQEKLLQPGINLLHAPADRKGKLDAQPAVVSVQADTFLQQPALHEELFGPFSMLVVCKDKAQLLEVLRALEGQLTTTVMATRKDLDAHADVLALQTSLAGRLVLNSVPTGVEVCAAMVHGGPFPATSDSRFTSVGSTAIRRWVRPFCFQGLPDELLPPALQNANPENILRLVDNVYTRDAIV